MGSLVSHRCLLNSVVTYPYRLATYLYRLCKSAKRPFVGEGRGPMPSSAKNLSHSCIVGQHYYLVLLRCCDLPTPMLHLCACALVVLQWRAVVASSATGPVLPNGFVNICSMLGFVALCAGGGGGTVYASRGGWVSVWRGGEAAGASSDTSSGSSVHRRQGCIVHEALRYAQVPAEYL